MSTLHILLDVIAPEGLVSNGFSKFSKIYFEIFLNRVAWVRIH